MVKYTKKQCKHLKTKSGKKNKTGKRLKRNGKKLIGGDELKYKVGDDIKYTLINVKHITKIQGNKEGNRFYVFDEEYMVPCNLVDNDKRYEKVEHEKIEPNVEQ